MRITPGKVLFALAALGPVVRAAVRIARLSRRHDLGSIADRLRSGAPLRPFLANPAWFAALVDRLLPLLPPYSLSPCAKRALVLLDLWSRCGLEPTLHLGVAGTRHRRFAHAWVTTATPRDHAAGMPYVEVWKT